MSRVQTRKSGRILTTIPKGEASTLDLDGQWVSWHVRSRDRLLVRPEGSKQPSDLASTRVRRDESSGSYLVDIPAALGRAMHLAGAELEWAVDAGDLYATATARGDDDGQ